MCDYSREGCEVSVPERRVSERSTMQEGVVKRA